MEGRARGSGRRARRIGVRASRLVSSIGRAGERRMRFQAMEADNDGVATETDSDNLGRAIMSGNFILNRHHREKKSARERAG